MAGYNKPERAKKIIAAAKSAETNVKQHRVCEIPVAQCQLLERNPQYLTPKQMTALKRSIERDGFVVPILVRPINSHRYEVVSGNHRFMAARELRYETVPAVVAKLSRNAAQRLALNLNLIHGDPAVEQLAPFLARLDDDVLADIHLEEKLRDDVLKFDETLQIRLKQLEPPLAVDTNSSLNHPDCMCPKCGRRHQSLRK